MKRTSSATRLKSRPRSVQRSSIRRAQSSGKRRSRKQAHKTVAIASASSAQAGRCSARAQTSAHGSAQAARTHDALAAQVAASQASAAIPPILQRGFVIAVAAVAMVAVAVVGLQNAPRWFAAATSAQATATAVTLGETRVAAAATAVANRIGIVSGHRGNDSGAVCDDGLTEAQVNFSHATRVADMLRAEGYTVDVLDEFDERLQGYEALVLLSIHADSCAYINELATGFKVARALESRQPDAEDDLVACLTSRYKRRTGLRFHANTVTRDMTQYHAFDEIAPDTPAAIIETGFMYLDRPLLTRKPELVAQGITEGLLCFIRGEAP